ncbi:MAG: hypothetical protein [Caudoviricetes sp.]|nr:MAG: hypothetical protein [Caudoviricetes sp.]
MTAFRNTNVIRVSVNSTAGVITSTNPVTVKNITTTGAVPLPGRLDQLTDVYAANEIDKATLVYDASTDRYIVKQIEFTEIDGPLDGGTF